MTSKIMTEKGVAKEANQDFAIADNENGIYVVADGFSGYSDESAWTGSMMLHQALRGVADSDGFKRAVQSANQKTYLKSQGNGKMYMSLAAVLISGDTLMIGHAGDVRVSGVVDGKYRQFTIDECSEYKALQEGSHKVDAYFSAEPVGPYNWFGHLDFKGNFVEHSLDGLTKIVLMSDGVTSVIPEERLAEIILGDDSASRLMEESDKVCSRYINRFLDTSPVVLNWLSEPRIVDSLLGSLASEQGTMLTGMSRKYKDTYDVPGREAILADLYAVPSVYEAFAEQARRFMSDDRTVLEVDTGR